MYRRRSQNLHGGQKRLRNLVSCNLLSSIFFDSPSERDEEAGFYQLSEANAISSTWFKTPLRDDDCKSLSSTASLVGYDDAPPPPSHLVDDDCPPPPPLIMDYDAPPPPPAGKHHDKKRIELMLTKDDRGASISSTVGSRTPGSKGFLVTLHHKSFSSCLLSWDVIISFVIYTCVIKHLSVERTNPLHRVSSVKEKSTETLTRKGKW